MHKDLKLTQRKRIKITKKHWLDDLDVIQRVFACLTEPNPLASNCWKDLMQMRRICSFFSTGVAQAIGLNAFEWTQGEGSGCIPVVRHKLTYSHSLLGSVPDMPALWRLFFSRTGDLPMPHPYATVPPSCSVRRMSFPGTPPLVPFLTRQSEDGIAAAVSVLMSEAGTLYLLQQRGAVPVTDVVVVPCAVRQACSGELLHDVGGFRFESHTQEPGGSGGQGGVWDVTSFMHWYRSVASDPTVGLRYMANTGTMCINPWGQCDREVDEAHVDLIGEEHADDSCVPNLCVAHMPAARGMGVVGDVADCGWHTLERKWVRNRAKHWRE